MGYEGSICDYDIHQRTIPRKVARCRNRSGFLRSGTRRDSFSILQEAESREELYEYLADPPKVTNGLRSELARELDGVSKEKWRSGRNRSDPSAGSVSWLPVASLTPNPGGPAVEIGLIRTGQWIVTAADNSFIEVETTENYLPLFPLVEMTHDEAFELLRSELAVRSFSEGWLRVFPVERLMAAALTSDSQFWPDFALRWVEKVQASDILIESLSFLKAHGKTQRLRPRAMRALADFRKTARVGPES